MKRKKKLTTQEARDVAAYEKKLASNREYQRRRRARNRAAWLAAHPNTRPGGEIK